MRFSLFNTFLSTCCFHCTQFLFSVILFLAHISFTKLNLCAMQPCAWNHTFLTLTWFCSFWFNHDPLDSIKKCFFYLLLVFLSFRISFISATSFQGIRTLQKTSKTIEDDITIRMKLLRISSCTPYNLILLLGSILLSFIRLAICNMLMGYTLLVVFLHSWSPTWGCTL